MPAQKKKQPAKKKQAKKKKAPAKKKVPAQKKAPARKKVPAKKKVQAKKKVAPKQESSLEKQPPRKNFSGDVYALFAQALGLLHQKKHKQASKQFTRLIEAFPGEIEVIARARSFLRICDGYLQHPKKDSARTPEEIFNQGVFHHNAAQYDKALGDYSRALKLSKKDNDHVYYAMAATEFSMGNADDALKHLEKAIQLNEENRFFAHNDPDFELLATNKQFRKLVYPE